MKRRVLIMAAPLAALAACANPGGNLPVLPDEARTSYRLGPEDRLRVTVFNDPRLTGEFRISDAGSIALPLIGSIPACGPLDGAGGARHRDPDARAAALP
jgi:polysaccharide export outer membrane protein